MSVKYYLVNFWLFTTLTVFAFQGNTQPLVYRIDSLSRIWYSSPAQLSDQSLLNVAFDLGVYYQDYNYDSLLSIAQGIETRGTKKQSQPWINQAHYWRGVYYHQAGKPDSAKLNLYYVIAHSAESDTIHLRSYSRLGSVYDETGQNDSALYCFQKVLSMRNQYQYLNHPKFYAMNSFDIGDIYSQEGKYIEALQYYTKGKNILLSSTTPNSSGNRYGAIQTGIIFKKLGLYEESKACYNEALTYPPNTSTPTSILRGIRMLITIAPDLNEVRKLVNNGQTIIDSLHLPIPALNFYTAAGVAFMDSLQYDQAEYYFNKALGVANGPHQKTARTALLLKLADINSNRRQYKESLQKCRHIQGFIEKNNTIDQLVQLYGVMSRCFEYLGQPDSALAYLKKKNVEEMKIGSKEALKANISAYLKFKNEEEQRNLKTDKTVAEKLAAEAKSKTILTIIFSLIIILILLGSSLLNNHYYRQKTQMVKDLEKLTTFLQAEDAKLRVSNLQLTRFNNIISHDVLSNLDLILSTGNLIDKKSNDISRLQQYYKMTQQTVQNLKKYCIDLLNHNKLSTGADNHLFDPMPQVTEVLQQFEWDLKEKGFIVDLQQLPESPVPPVHITHIFYNLISNTLRYAQKQNTPRLSIEGNYSWKGQKRWVVTDNGPGISRKTWLEIIEKGQTSSSAGNGIGLGQVVATVQEYGGEINLDTPDVGGTRIVITFPTSPKNNSKIDA